MSQCPFCPFELQCHHEGVSLFSDLGDDKTEKTDSFQFLADELSQLPSSIQVETPGELFPDEVNEHTMLVDPVKFEPLLEKKWYECDQCKYRSKECENLRRHYLLKHGDGTEIPWYNCEFCPYKCKQKSALNVHFKHKHTPAEEITWHHCDQCAYKTKTKSCLGYHKLLHKPENIQWHPCGSCDYRAKTKSRLNKHVSELHSAPGDIKWLKCDHCRMYITRRNSSLKLHIRRKHSEVAKKQK